MSAITQIVSFARKLSNGRFVSVGNQVQLGDADGEPLGTVDNPLITSGGGGGGVASQVQLVDEFGGPFAVSGNPAHAVLDNTAAVRLVDLSDSPFAVSGNPSYTVITNSIGDPLGSEAFPFFATEAIFSGTVNPAMSASPDYIAGDCIGIPTNVLTQGVGGDRLILRGAFVSDSAGQAPALTILFFDGTLNGAGGTYTDNSPLVWGTSDKAKVIGSLSIASANYLTVAGLSVQNLSNIDLPLVVGGSNLGVLVVAAGAYNGATTSDLRLTFSWRLASA